uniref:PHD-type domain-containing protein n=1 Tax=Dicentrarchus labrax TaxID=13489 RepID=A0A8C4EFH1_DICLA
MKRGKTNNINTDSCKDSTSDTEINNSKSSQSSTAPKSPQFAVHKNSKKEPEPLSHPDPSRSLVCCLCGQSANAMDLGDLHGPYYPEGYQPSTKTPAGTSGLKEDEDDYSDSSSSSCSMRGRGRKRAVPHTPRPLRPGARLKEKGLLESQRWCGDGTGSPAAKRARSDATSADVEDWYSPPVLPLEPCEYWLHEDCGIWSAGVFLVKGKVYGLEEAVKVAQETMCSGCRDPGATLGCFFKGCPNKYHYRCALESGEFCSLPSVLCPHTSQGSKGQLLTRVHVYRYNMHSRDE